MPSSLAGLKTLNCIFVIGAGLIGTRPPHGYDIGRGSATQNWVSDPPAWMVAVPHRGWPIPVKMYFDLGGNGPCTEIGKRQAQYQRCGAMESGRTFLGPHALAEPAQQRAG